MEDRVAGEERDHGAGREERGEGNREPAGAEAVPDEQDGARNEGEEQAQHDPERGRPAGEASAAARKKPAAPSAPIAHTGEGWAAVRSASTAAAAGSTTRFGTTRRSRSVAVTTTSAPQATAAAARRLSPKASTQPTRSSAVPSSIARSRGGIRSPQARQRPRSARYETTGTLSYQRIGDPQRMQAEPGRTTERRSGTRAATTPRKLPSARPGRKTSGRTRSISFSLSTAGARRLSGGRRRPQPPNW